MASKIEQLVNEIGGLTALELSELAKTLGSTFGVSAVMPAAAAPAAAAATAEAPKKEEEKAEYKVELLTSGPEKIKTIKALRSVTSLELTKAKQAVEEAKPESPSVIAEAAPKAEADKIKAALEAAGATVKLS